VDRNARHGEREVSTVGVLVKGCPVLEKGKVLLKVSYPVYAASRLLGKSILKGTYKFQKGTAEVQGTGAWEEKKGGDTQGGH